ncbi:MAG TPA: hypothetical protein VHB01_12830 [Nitrosospira sp.]|jgi:hypothetical protein|nr:hypothetical protein [Nitrosospira sp.]
MSLNCAATSLHSPAHLLYFESTERAMNNIIYTVGLIVIVLAILKFAGVI